jgi:predicted transcriptional regulator
VEDLRARDVMSAPVIVVRTTDPIPDVIRTMRRHGITGVPVVDGFGLMVGIISEADIVAMEAGPEGPSELRYRRSLRPTASDGAYRAEDVMTESAIAVAEDTPIKKIARLMAREDINRVPVVRGEDLAGIVTRKDILALLVKTPSAVLGEVRSSLRDDLNIDPDELEIVVINGDVRLRGVVECNVDAIRRRVTQIPGVSRIDVSGLKAEPATLRASSAQA